MIRVATPADAAGIARVHVATWRAAYPGMVPAPALDALNVPAAASRWEGLLADEAARAWVAVADREVTAFAAAGPARDADLPETCGEVYAAYVSPAAQRAGLGRALVGEALEWFASAGRTNAALWVLSGNVAGRRFYEASGWVQEGFERMIDVGGGVVPEVRYARNLPLVRALS